MVRTNKCGFCGRKGHNITHCNCEHGLNLLNHIQSRSIDYLVMSNRSLSVFDKSVRYYNFIKESLQMKEIRFMLAKNGSSIRGNKTLLAARYIHDYFFAEIVLDRFPDILSYDDRVHIEEYVKYWNNLSSGVSLQQCNIDLNDYFEFVDSLEVFDSDYDYDTISTKYKNLINVSMNELDQETETFECAICMDDNCSTINKVVFDCKHSFCKECVTQVFLTCQTKKNVPSCALCRRDCNKIQVYDSNVFDDFRERFCLENVI